ncbi:MAG TPA: hypothetical protein PK299_03090 [Anaerolineales bacterium]|nr:hypothetical protein [Anaerolineales bacterium]
MGRKLKRFAPIGFAGLVFFVILLIHPPVVRQGVSQTRSPIVYALHPDTQGLEQTFIPQNQELRGVRLWLAVLDPAILQASPTHPQLTLQIFDDASGERLASVQKTWESRQHNDLLLFQFPVLQNVAGRQLRWQLQISDAPDVVAVWGSDYNGLTSGQLWQDGVLQAGDLRFTTEYQVGWWESVRSLGAVAGEWAQLLLWVVLLAALPGMWLVRWSGWDKRLSRWEQLTLAVVIGFCLWMILWVYSTAVGWRWQSWHWWLLAGGNLLASGVWLARQPPAQWQSPSLYSTRVIFSTFTKNRIALSHLRKTAPFPFMSNIAQSVLLACTAFLALTSALSVSHIKIPPLVDVPNHAYLAQKIAELGAIPATIPIQETFALFYYHPGYHLSIATLMQASKLPVETVSLLLGVFYQVWAGLACAMLVRRLSGSDWAAVAALVLVGFISRFPLQMTEWGRLTQLYSSVLLALALWLVTVCDAEKPAHWVLTGILIAGVLISHYRVLIFLFVFCGVVFGWQVVVAVQSRKLASVLARWLSVVGCAFVGVLPWLIRLVEQVLVRTLQNPVGLRNGLPNYERFPWEYLTSYWEWLWLSIALLGMVLAIWQGKRWAVWLLLWSVLLFGLLDPRWLGLPATWLVVQNTWYIAFWVPGSVGFAWAVWQAGNWLARHNAELLRWVVPLSLAVVLGLGWFRSVGVLPTASEIATNADQEALYWVRDNTPPDAKFLINLWPWYQGTTYAGGDGGYWLPAIALRQTTTPTFIRGQVLDLTKRQEMKAFEDLAWGTTDIDSPVFLTALSQARVEYAYIGAAGQHFTPEQFLKSPNWELLFSNGESWVFLKKP